MSFRDLSFANKWRSVLGLKLVDEESNITHQCILKELPLLKQFDTQIQKALETKALWNHINKYNNKTDAALCAHALLSALGGCGVLNSQRGVRVTRGTSLPPRTLLPDQKLDWLPVSKKGIASEIEKVVKDFRTSETDRERCINVMYRTYGSLGRLFQKAQLYRSMSLFKVSKLDPTEFQGFQNDVFKIVIQHYGRTPSGMRKMIQDMDNWRYEFCPDSLQSYTEVDQKRTTRL